MLSSLTTKLALKKAGLPSDALDFSFPSTTSSNNTKDAGANTNTSWLSAKSLPLTIHPWFSPPPPPVAVSRVPQIGDLAPLDRQRRLQLGRRTRCLVVFLRCVGCAFAQKTFLHLRAIANRHAGRITCIAVSHSSARATAKWIDLLGGAWNVQVVIDTERAVYAAWGLGIASSLWYVLSPASQVQSWRETGWLGEQVAGAIQGKGTGMRRGQEMMEDRYTARPGARNKRNSSYYKSGIVEGPDGGGGTTTTTTDGDGLAAEMGSKWQEAGAFAVDGRGTVVWGGKAMRADDVMDLDEGAKLLML